MKILYDYWLNLCFDSVRNHPKTRKIRTPEESMRLLSGSPATGVKPLGSDKAPPYSDIVAALNIKAPKIQSPSTAASLVPKRRSSR